MPRSLHLRLLGGAAIAIAAALALAWLAMTWLFERHVERRLAADLTRTGGQLAAALSIDAAGGPRLDEPPADPRAQRPLGGLYWQVSTARSVVRSPSLWDSALPAAADARRDSWTARRTSGPLRQDVLVVARVIETAQSDIPAVIQVGGDTRELTDARAEFGRELGLFLLVLWGVLSLAAFAQVRLGLAPLAGLRAELAGMRRNANARLEGEHPPEIAPLVAAINELAAAREGDVARARRRAGDLAHSLKTPLSALAAQSRRAREAGATDAADGLDRAIAAVGATLETELARARAAAARSSAGALSSAAQVVENLTLVLERTEDGGRLAFTHEIPADLVLPVAAEALTETLGALMENAVRHAHRQVTVRGERDKQTSWLTVEDDGPGLSDARAEAALIRGGRLDEAGPGHGLGLAIARDLVEATGGEIALGRSALGGLCVSVRWPS